MELKHILRVSLLLGLLFSASLRAETVLNYLTDANDVYVGPSVEDNIKIMDKDKNGFADASEVRAYLESLHGKGYESALLDRFEASVKGTSCATPFAKSFYVSN